MVDTYLKEEAEKIRQILVLKKYFSQRKALFEARQAKFIRMYPYVKAGEPIDLQTFELAVKNADDSQKLAISNAFEQEKKYWGSAYVLDNCNCNIHTHILNTLEAMKKIIKHEIYGGSDELSKDTRKEGDSKEQKSVFNTSNKWGNAGEEAVEYVLKWLPNLYCVIENDCVSKYSDNTILLENPILTDETQEFDHLVIGPQGVFNIETKNYSGKVYIDKAGNWMRLKKGENEWTPEENPAQQLFRHHVMLQSILGDQVPIIDVICMSHPSLMISGQGNSAIPIIRKDLLADFIVNYHPAGLSQNQVLAIRDKINSSKTRK